MEEKIKFDIWSLGMTLIELADLSHPLQDKNIIETTSAISDPAIQFAIKNYAVFTQDCHNFVANCLIRDWRARPDYELLIVCALLGLPRMTASHRRTPSSRTTKSTSPGGLPGSCTLRPSILSPGTSMPSSERMNQQKNPTKEASLAVTFLLVAAARLPASMSAADKIVTSASDDRTYRHVALDNGLNVLLIHDPSCDKAAAAMDVHIGSYSDPRDLPGLAHFLGASS